MLFAAVKHLMYRTVDGGYYCYNAAVVDFASAVASGCRWLLTGHWNPADEAAYVDCAAERRTKHGTSIAGLHSFVHYSVSSGFL